jgi:hypothetical protein
VHVQDPLEIVAALLSNSFLLQTPLSVN